jgi:hypothetical protein
MTGSGLGCAKTFLEFAVYRTELGFTGFDTGLTVLPDFRRYDLPQARQFDDIAAHAVLLA